jgi:hypothetical protein
MAKRQGNVTAVRRDLSSVAQLLRAQAIRTSAARISSGDFLAIEDGHRVPRLGLDGHCAFPRHRTYCHSHHKLAAKTMKISVARTANSRRSLMVDRLLHHGGAGNFADRSDLNAINWCG